jgi:hypothetical protein
MFFGKILRDQQGDKTLKQLQVNNQAQLVIQILPEPEFLELNTMILLGCKRNIGDRTYGQKTEFKFTYPPTGVPKIADLVASCKAHLSIGD